MMSEATTPTDDPTATTEAVPPAVEAYGLNVLWRLFAERHGGDLDKFRADMDRLALLCEDFVMTTAPLSSAWPGWPAWIVAR
jgi:hypothetical protein